MNEVGTLVELTPGQRQAFGHKPQVVAHHLHQSELFDDACLAALIDKYPRKWLQAFTMGTNPECRKDWAAVEIGEISGTEILQAVMRGRLWLNILNTQEVDARFKHLLDRLYDGLAEQCRGFSTLTRSGTLLVSSPGAQVYYHVDGPPNFLWHIRGEKRVMSTPREIVV